MGNMEHLNFNAGETEPMGDFSPLPAGLYRALIMDSEWKTTQTGGQYLQLQFEVIDGKHSGRYVWSRLNLVNKSDKAVEIARGELSAICRAVGVLEPKDSIELHNKPLVIKVIVEARNDNGEPTNRIKGYEALEGGARPKPKTNTTAVQQPVYTPQGDDDLPF